MNEEKKELVEHSWDIGELYLQELPEHQYNTNRQCCLTQKKERCLEFGDIDVDKRCMVKNKKTKEERGYKGDALSLNFIQNASAF